MGDVSASLPLDSGLGLGHVCASNQTESVRTSSLTESEICSGSEAGSYLRLIDFVYHSTLGLRVIKRREEVSVRASPPNPPAGGRDQRHEYPAKRCRVTSFIRNSPPP